MNPLLSHQLTQMALYTQHALLAEAAAERLIRQAEPRAAAPSPYRSLRSRFAGALHALAVLLDHTTAATPRPVAL